MRLIKTNEDQQFYDELTDDQKYELELEFHNKLCDCGNNIEVMSQLDKEIGVGKSTDLILEIIYDLMFDQIELN